MDFKEKSESLADKMNKITSKFSENLDTTEELLIEGGDVVEFVEEKTKDITLSQSTLIPAAEIINLDNMVSDFRYVRDTLKENIENGRRVLNSITIDLLAADEENRAALVIAFAELNKAIADNTKIYISSYKNISDILLNIDKVKKQEKQAFEEKGNVTNNTLNIHTNEPISTVDLIKQLNNQKNGD